jgi:RNA polymerase sigma-70 factor, ECF subfamily
MSQSWETGEAVVTRSLENTARSRSLSCPRPTPAAGTFDDLLKTHGAEVARWVARSAPFQDRSDLVQEILLAAFIAWPRFRGDAMPSTWLFSITDRILFRTQSRQRRLGRFQSEEEQAEALPASSPSPARKAEINEQLESLGHALEQLPAKHRQAYTLHEFEGLSAAGIADLIGTTENNVWLWLHRARKRLRTLLLDQDPCARPLDGGCRSGTPLRQI